MRLARLLTALLKCRPMRRFGVTKGFVIAVIVCVASLVILSQYVWNSAAIRRIVSDPPTPAISCRRSGNSSERDTTNDHGPGSGERLRADPRVLVFAETPYTTLGQDVLIILESLRLRYRMEVVSGGGGKTLPSLTHADRGRFSVVVFERLETYLSLDSWNRQLLDKYCRDYDVGMIAFAQPDEALYNAQVRTVRCF
jgi:hypothetical protein